MGKMTGMLHLETVRRSVGRRRSQGSELKATRDGYSIGIFLSKDDWKVGKDGLRPGKGRSLIFGDMEGFYRLYLAAENACSSRRGWGRAKLRFSDGTRHEIVLLRVDRKRDWKMGRF